MCGLSSARGMTCREQPDLVTQTTERTKSQQNRSQEPEILSMWMNSSGEFFGLFQSTLEQAVCLQRGWQIGVRELVPEEFPRNAPVKQSQYDCWISGKTTT